MMRDAIQETQQERYSKITDDEMEMNAVNKDRTGYDQINIKT